jgi:hypothetical protein
MVFGFLIRFKQIQPIKFFQALINQNPTAIAVAIHLAFTVFCTAAGTVKKAFRAKCQGAQSTSIFDDAFAAK